MESKVRKLVSSGKRVKNDVVDALLKRVAVIAWILLHDGLNQRAAVDNLRRGH